MKTAVSMPDDTFTRATSEAAARGMSRSELVTRAVQEYLRRLDDEDVPHQIDAALEVARGGDDPSRAAVAAGRALLSADDDW